MGNCEEGKYIVGARCYPSTFQDQQSPNAVTETAGLALEGC